MQHFVKIFQKKHSWDRSKDMRAVQKWPKPRIEVFVDDVDCSETLISAGFEKITSDLSKDTLGPVKQVLEDSSLRRKPMHESLGQTHSKTAALGATLMTRRRLFFKLLRRLSPFVGTGAEAGSGTSRIFEPRVRGFLRCHLP